MKIHWSSDWTRGCIALTNEQIEDLSRFIGVGTRVVINE
jgi:lipoprotein-anchoring transpeptidase ErfK/SrfK